MPVKILCFFLVVARPFSAYIFSPCNSFLFSIISTCIAHTTSTRNVKMSADTKKRKVESESETNSDVSADSKPLSTPETPKKETVSSSQTSAASQQKPVFGASSSFGKAAIFDSIKKVKNVFDSSHKESASQSISAAPANATSSFGSFGSSFGANSKFSNAFQQASKKRSFLDEPEVANAQTLSPVASAPQYKQVELKAKEVKTGEENETPIFTSLAKLFELPLDKISEGWKERGVGPLHLNRSIEDPSQIRLVMRSHGILRVILNYKITPKTVLIKGLDASLSPGKFLRINSISTSGAPLQYLLKFSDQTIRDSLCEKIATLQADFKAIVQPVVAKEETAPKAEDYNDEVEVGSTPKTDFDSLEDTLSEEKAEESSEKALG